MKYCILLLTGLLSLVGCSDEIDPGRTDQRPPVIRGLTTEPAGLTRGATQRTLNGTVESLDQSQLVARLPGRVKEVLIKEGQTARAGETILTLAEQTATDEMAAARARVQAAQGGLAEAEAHQLLAAQTLQRYQQLREGTAVTSQELDQVRMTEAAARQKVQSARADLAAAQASLNAAKVLAGQVHIKAPFDARINHVLVDAGSTVMPGTPLVQFDRIGPWRVSLEIPESLVGQFRPGQEFIVEIPSTGQKLTAVLSEIYPAAKPLSHTLTAKLALPSNDTLKSGQYAKVSLPGTGTESLVVPTSAIVTRGQLTAVYVLSEGLLHYRLVRTGATVDGRTEILAGLSPAEIIVTEGVTRARHGARVEE